MLNSLRVRMFLMVFLVVAAAVGTVSAFASRGTTTAMEGFFTAHVERDERIALTWLAGPGQRGDLPGLQIQAQELGQAMNAQILVVDVQGAVLVDSRHQLDGQVIPLPTHLANTAPPSLVVRNQPAFILLSYAPGPRPDAIPPFSSRPGQVMAPAQDYLISAPAQNVLGSINRSLLLAAAAGGGVALLVTLVLSRPIVERVEALTRAARRMEKGDLSQRVPIQSDDEIGALARAFNAMADGLARTEQLRRHMVGDIAHELRTPLTNIRGYLEAVKDGVLEAQPEVVDSLYEETMLLNRLVEDLQELALAEAGRLKLEPHPVAVAEIVSKTLAGLAPQLATRPLVQVDVPGNLPLVRADSARIRQVLRNLLTNAFQHTPPAGVIVVSARCTGERVEISMRDTGSGIASEHLPNVFERFYRADASRARATGGAGLGLTIVRQLVEAHGGQVRVATALGQGTTFTFTLPIATEI